MFFVPFSERHCHWRAVADGKLRVIRGNVHYTRVRQTVADQRVEGACLFGVLEVSVRFMEHFYYGLTELKNRSLTSTFFKQVPVCAFVHALRLPVQSVPS